MRLPRLHVVTDDTVLARESFVAEAARVIAAGGEHVAIHVRGPHSSGRRLHDTFVALRSLAAASGADLFVNDRVDIALAECHAAVHLGRRSISASAARKLLGPEGRIGLSCHKIEEVERAAPEGADFVFMGTIYGTPSHPERRPLGPDALRLARGHGVPVVAIGGVNVERVAEVLEAGAHGVAVVSGVWGASDPAEATEEYLRGLGAPLDASGAWTAGE